MLPMLKLVELDKKSDVLSTRIRNEGNKVYKTENFVAAIEIYNKALCYAVSSENLALAYGNRSAVYCELQKYKKCLENIQWARENNYPAEKVHNLNEREQKCKKIIEQQSKMVPSDFMKLSYKPNPKIPFIVECLELRTTEEFGRGIYTTHDLNCGDIIAFDKPVFKSFKLSAKYRRCFNCLTIQMLNLIPCVKTASIMFCSIECREQVYAKFTDLRDAFPFDNFEEIQLNRNFLEISNAFGGLSKLHEYIKTTDYKNSKKTIFDYDFSDPKDPCYEMNRMKAALSLKLRDYSLRKYKAVLLDMFKVHRMKPNHAEFLIHLHEILLQHSMFCLTVCTTVSGVHNFYNLLNHSCHSNVSFSELDGEIVCVVNSPIKAGEQLFVSYIGAFAYNNPPSARQRALASYNFICGCLLCIEDTYIQKLQPVDLGGLKRSDLFFRIMRSEFDHKDADITEVEVAKIIHSQIVNSQKKIHRFGYDELSYGYNVLGIQNIQYFALCCNYLQLPTLVPYKKKPDA